MTKKTTLGELLAKARVIKDVSLRDVESETGISNAYISQLESGSVTEPSPHKLLELAKYYELDYSTLMEAAGYVFPSEENRRHHTNNAQALLLTEQPLTEAESAALTAFLIQFRRLVADSTHTKSKRAHK